MTAPNVETVADHIRAAISLLLAGERDNADGTITYDARDIDAIEGRLYQALEPACPKPDRTQLRLLDQPRRHALSTRHHMAIRALAAATLSDVELRAVIGGYATNVIKSLVARGLIEPGAIAACEYHGWILTPAGWSLHRELTTR